MEPSAPDAATIWDARFNSGAAAPNAAANPIWPATTPGTSQSRARGATLSPMLMAAIAAALVILLVMAVTLGGLIGGENPLGAFLGTSPSPTTAPTATLLPTATPSPSPSPSPTPPANWLSVDQTTLSLGCNGSKRTQYIHMTNVGLAKLAWYEHSPTFLSGVTVRPSSGTLGVGRTVTIAVTNSATLFPHQGELDFIPSGDNAAYAGNTVVVTYSTSCG